MKNAILVTLLLCLSTCGLQAAEQPNILFIITDDMYPRQMNFMPQGKGKNYTPNLDRLANEGTVMRNQYVSSPVCTPSRYSVMTGRYASRAQAPEFVRETQRLGQTHVQWNTFADPAKEKTIAHHLGAAGYRTGFVGKDHAIFTPGRKHLGLSSDVEDPAVQASMKENALASETAIHKAGFEFVDRVYQNNPDFNGSMTLAVHNQDWITEGALNFLDDKDDRPFFLYFATTTPHGPTEAGRSWKADRRATPDGWLEHPPEVQPDSASIARRAKENNVKGTETLIWIDDAIGALLQKLEASGELDNTIIFFFNDHGQSAKGSVYQGGVHNPSIVWRHKGWPAGPQTQALVSNIDFTPTMLDIAGVPSADNIDGVSFLPLLQNKETSVRDSLYFEMGFTRGVMKDNLKYIAVRYPPAIDNMSLEERQARLTEMNNNLRERGRPVHSEDPTAAFGHLMPIPGGHDAEQGAITAFPHYHDPDQLYNVLSDPNEKVNLASDKAYSEKLEDMKTLMQSYLVTLPGVFPL